MESTDRNDRGQFTSEAMRNKFVEARSRYYADVLRLIEAGYPVNRIATEIGVSRTTVNSCLKDLNIPLPSVSEGNAKAARFLTPEQRRDRAASAHAAIRILGRNRHTQADHAAREEESKRYVGFGEAEILQFLQSRGITCRQQVALDGYNIDIFAGDHLAVEVHHFINRPFGSTQRLRKTVKLLCRGVSVAFVWIDPRTRVISSRALDEVVTFFQQTGGNPSPIGQYRVIRGDGEIDWTSERHFNELAAVLAEHSRLKAANVDK